LIGYKKHLSDRQPFTQGVSLAAGPFNIWQGSKKSSKDSGEGRAKGKRASEEVFCLGVNALLFLLYKKPVNLPKACVYGVREKA
jgi:hypothetical protein